MLPLRGEFPTFRHTIKIHFAMRWRLTACIVPLAVLVMGFGAHGAWSAPLMQPALGDGLTSFQRVDAQRPSNNSLKHCLTRKGASSCHGAAKAGKIVRAPDVPQYPHGDAGSPAATDTLPLPNSPPPAGRTKANRAVDRRPAGEAQAGDPAPGVKFTGGMGVPTNRAELEGTLSPYQLPNGNTSASQSGKLTNGLENQGMHFGIELHY